MKVNIVFKNGFVLPVECETFTIEKNIYGDITSYNIKGIKDNKPLYVCIEDVLCIYREGIKEEL